MGEMSPARRKKQRAEDRDQGLPNNGGLVRVEPALTKRKNDLAHWETGETIRSSAENRLWDCLSETPATTAKADRRRMEAETCRLNIV